MHIVAQTCVKIDANMPREDAGVFVSCADCRVIIFQTLEEATRIWIKVTQPAVLLVELTV